ncbi:MAG: lytic transglycosylase domain-containing protein [Candidatus Pacearchaeota archaeon]|nr:lytic transglycosylase domain-containing protein [Candidatus Pacearchaeota archaeon]
MVKKLTCVLALTLAGLLAPMKANVSGYQKPIQSENFYELSEKIFREKEIKKAMKKIEEKDWEKDKIWQIISSYYSESEMPEYISKRFIRTLIKIESCDVPTAKSWCGARGLGQIMKDTWYGFEKENFEENAFIPEKNVNVMIKCLKSADNFYRQNHSDWENISYNEKMDIIAAGYNMGPYGAKKVNWDISKMPKETQKYVPTMNKVFREITPAD